MTVFLDNEGIGKLSEITRIVGVLSILFGFGYYSQIIRSGDGRKLKIEFTYVVQWLLISLIFTCPLIFTKFSLIWLVLATSFVLSFLNFLRTEARVFNNTKKYVRNEYIFVLVSSLLTMCLVYLYPLYTSRVWSLLLAYVVTTILYNSLKLSFVTKPKEFIYLKDALSVLPHSVFRWFRVRSDIIFIGLFYSASMQGDFAIATSICTLSMVLYDTYNQWFISIAKSKFERGLRKEWLKLVYWSISLYLIVMILNYLASNFIYDIFNWKDFSGGAVYILPLLVIFLLRSIVNLLTTYFNYFRLNNILSMITILSSVIFAFLLFYSLQQSIYHFLWASCSLEAIVVVAMLLLIRFKNVISFS